MTEEEKRLLASVADDDLVAECVRRGWRVVYPGSEADRYLFEPPDPDVKTAREQAVLDALEKLFDGVEAMRKAKAGGCPVHSTPAMCHQPDCARVPIDGSDFCEGHQG